MSNALLVAVRHLDFQPWKRPDVGLRTTALHYAGHACETQGTIIGSCGRLAIEAFAAHRQMTNRVAPPFDRNDVTLNDRRMAKNAISSRATAGGRRFICPPAAERVSTIRSTRIARPPYA